MRKMRKKKKDKKIMNKCRNSNLAVIEKECKRGIEKTMTWGIELMMKKLTKVVFPTPCMPLTPTNKGGAALPEDEYFNRCRWRFFMMKGMQ